MLWQHLRNRKCGGLKFRRQQCFGPYILDFYCPEQRLGVELDGGQHDDPDVRARDEARGAFLAGEGKRTLRFWNHQIRENLAGVVERIRRECGVGEPLTLTLSPEGRGNSPQSEESVLIK